MTEQGGSPADRIRMIVMGVMTVVILALMNVQIAGKERVVRDGDTVLLQLAPRDPRSLLQGDYMALRYSATSAVAAAADAADVSNGRVIIELVPAGVEQLPVARVVGIDDGRQLTGNERRLRFRKRGDTVRLASDAYFFEEGTWEIFAQARYGELRVDQHGEAVLTGLRDAAGNRLGPPLH